MEYKEETPIMSSISSDNNLPSEYKETNYIRCTGSQYINTNISPTNHTIEIKYEVSQYVNNSFIFGTSSNNYYYHFTEYSSKYFWGLNGSETSGGTWSSGQHVIKYNYGENSQVILDDAVLGSNSTISCSSGSTLYIGKRGSTAPFVGNYYYVKITNKSTSSLVRNYIPCYRVSDNKPGMYDTVSGSFFVNQGSSSDFLIDWTTASITPEWETCHQVIGSTSNIIINSPATVPTNTTLRSVIKFSGVPVLYTPTSWVWNNNFSMESDGINEIILSYDSVSGKINATGYYFKTL